MARVLEPTGDAGAGTATFRRRPCDDEEVTDRCEFDGIEGEAEIGLCADQFTQTLRGLERDGLVERTLYPTVPPRVEYALTGGGSGAAAHRLRHVRMDAPVPQTHRGNPRAIRPAATDRGHARQEPTGVSRSLMVRTALS
jgi:hypothetical protein